MWLWLGLVSRRGVGKGDILVLNLSAMKLVVREIHCLLSLMFFCLYSIFRKFMNKGEIPIFSDVLCKFLSTLSKASPGLFVINIDDCFSVLYMLSYPLLRINYWILFFLVLNSFVPQILFDVKYVLICLSVFLWVFYSPRIKVKSVSSI